MTGGFSSFAMLILDDLLLALGKVKADIDKNISYFHCRFAW